MKKLKVRYGLILLLSMVPICLYSQSNKLMTEHSELSISGTSTLHDWEIVAEDIIGYANVKMEEDQIVELSEIMVEIPILGLKSGKAIMDKKTYSALKQDQYKTIKYKLIKLHEIRNNSENTWSVKATGILDIAGVKNEVLMSVNASLTQDYINFQGQTIIDMTEYLIDPPTAVMGTIRTGKDVTIQFNINFSKFKSQSHENSN